MKFRIKYSYERDSGYGSTHKATAYPRYGIISNHTCWDNSFEQARHRLIEWLIDWKASRDEAMAIKLARKQNPPPATEVVEI